MPVANLWLGAHGGGRDGAGDGRRAGLGDGLRRSGSRGRHGDLRSYDGNGRHRRGLGVGNCLSGSSDGDERGGGRGRGRGGAGRGGGGGLNPDLTQEQTLTGVDLAHEVDTVPRVGGGSVDGVKAKLTAGVGGAGQGSGTDISELGLGRDTIVTGSFQTDGPVGGGSRVGVGSGEEDDLLHVLESGGGTLETDTSVVAGVGGSVEDVAANQRGGRTGVVSVVGASPGPVTPASLQTVTLVGDNSAGGWGGGHRSGLGGKVDRADVDGLGSSSVGVDHDTVPIMSTRFSHDVSDAQGTLDESATGHGGLADLRGGTRGRVVVVLTGGGQTKREWAVGGDVRNEVVHAGEGGVRSLERDDTVVAGGGDTFEGVGTAQGRGTSRVVEVVGSGIRPVSPTRFQTAITGVDLDSVGGNVGGATGSANRDSNSGTVES